MRDPENRIRACNKSKTKVVAGNGIAYHDIDGRWAEAYARRDASTVEGNLAIDYCDIERAPVVCEPSTAIPVSPLFAVILLSTPVTVTDAAGWTLDPGDAVIKSHRI